MLSVIRGSGARVVALLTLTFLISGPARPQAPPRGGSPVAARAYRHPDLHIANLYRRADRLPGSAAQRARQRLVDLGIAVDRGFLDVRGDRWGTLFPELFLEMADLPAGPAPGTPDHRGQAAADAVVRYLRANQQALGIQVDELGPPRVTSTPSGELVQIYFPRVFRGLPVRDSSLSAVVSHGHLTLLGTRNWGDIRVPIQPLIPAERARSILLDRLAPFTPSGFERGAVLTLVPTAGGRDPASAPIGEGYRYRLVWVLEPRFASDVETWEALIDAHSGELLAFRDANRYATARKVTGGVYPASDDGLGPSGTEQPGYPMPYCDVGHGGRRSFTDGGGNLPLCVDGPITTGLDGAFVSVTELCGPISESSTTDLDLGAGSGTDCAVPAGAASAGNTHSARTVFYHLNRIREQAKGQLPTNPWLANPLGAITNFPPALLGCNAFWDGSTVTFFGGDPAFPPNGCSNTGELAGVIHHEWAHGLDDNDANGHISTPGEDVADVFAALWLNDSCIGRGFYNGEPCDPGDNDPCLSCDGVRDIDWAQRASGQAHDIAFIDSSCPVWFIGDPGPCGGPLHCEGALVAEAMWDLVHRDLPGFYAMDLHTALEVATRLFYLGSGLIGSSFQCIPGTGIGDGCNADSAFLNLLAVDDDNGSLADGTPHLRAIRAAFARHGIACDTPSVQDGGCLGGPGTPPGLTVTPLDRGARLVWSAVGGADRYAVFRSEGVLGCNAGKIKLGETTDLEWIDQGLQNGFEYSYVVLPVGSADSCLGPASACSTVTPSPGPNLALDPGSANRFMLSGDGDEAIDNCETVEVDFDLHNIGLGSLTNVRLLAAEAVSHPGTVQVLTPFPSPVAPLLGECATAQASFQFMAAGLQFNDTLEFRVRFTADELAGLVRSQTLRLQGVESDTTAHASRTFSFESDLDGWQVVQGTFDRTGGGGGHGTAIHLASSSFLPDQCDQVRSPFMRLSPTSTLSAWTWFDIEGPLVDPDLDPFIFWFDRANLAVLLESTEQRIPISPDGGRLYNAGGTDGSCVTMNQDGWADSMPTWAESTWSSSALTGAVPPGEVLRLDIGYGTDVAVEGEGFRIDEITVTDLELIGPDSQSDQCPAPGTHLLTVTTSGTGSGTVTSSPAGIDCGSDCAHDYDHDTVVTLTPTPDTGSTFSRWSGHADCSDGAVTMDGARACTATFDLTPPATHTLSVARTGSGSGTVTSSPAGIDCGSDCAHDYDHDTVVTLTPTPDTGSTFSGWSGHADCTDGAVTMDGTRACTATFDSCVDDPPLDVSGQIVSTALTLEACSTLEAGQFEILGPNGDVVFRAVRSIVLKNGFAVHDGAEFRAETVQP